MIGKGDNILSTDQFDKDAIFDVLVRAKKMEEILKKGEPCDLAKGKILAALFFEPSTRTRFSFETAMYRLGGSVISEANMMNVSSIKKRETLEDTAQVVSRYVDVVAMRHPEVGSVDKFASKSLVPVINAGDGPSQHPTQGLLDMYTIWKEKGEIDGLTIGMGGDLKNSRVLHSQCELLRHFKCNYIFVSPPELAMQNEIVEDLRSRGSEVKITDNYEEFISEMDVINCSRIQEERFADKSEYEKYAGLYVMDKALLNKGKDDAIVLHPLPRVDEISEEIDDDSRTKYFDQVENGVVVRMALLSKVLGIEV